MREFSDPGLTIEEQIDLFKRRKLTVTDPVSFAAFLSKVSFQRLKPYAAALAKGSATYEFNSGVTDLTLEELYFFDNDLQKLLFKIISSIEVALKTKLVNKMSLAHGPHWLLENTFFDHNTEKTWRHFIHADGTEELRQIEITFFQQLMSRIRENCHPDSEELYVRKYYANWDKPDHPPCWIVFEELTFGTVSKLFSSLNVREIKKEIAREFGMVDALFEAMLKSMVYVRNLCAHHKFVWKRSLTIRPTLPRKKSNRLLIEQDYADERKLYVFLSCLVHITNASNVYSDAKKQLLALLNSHPDKIQAMGFPENWFREPIWQLS